MPYGIIEFDQHGLGNGLSPGHHQAIKQTNVDLLSSEPIGNKLQGNLSQDTKVLTQEPLGDFNKFFEK